MTGDELLQMAMEFVESDKAELNKKRLEFELKSEGKMSPWQCKIIEKDNTRLMIMSGLIQIIQAQAMESDGDIEILQAIDELESKMSIKGGIDLRDHVIEVLITELDDIFKNVQFLPKSLTRAFLLLKLKRCDKLLCDYKIKVFEANNIPYVITKED